MKIIFDIITLYSTYRYSKNVVIILNVNYIELIDYNMFNDILS